VENTKFWEGMIVGYEMARPKEEEE